MTELVVGPDTRITLHFALSLEDGREVDSTFGKSPATFEYGDGNLLPGFEKHLLGLGVGACETFTVPPEDAFGQPNPANVQRFPRGDFAEDMELAEGLVISFADAARAELPGVVKSFSDGEVVVDFNHPLAGHTLKFKVEVVDLQVR